MVTRVLAETTKVKNNWIKGKKTFKRILSFFLVVGKKFKFAFEDFIFVVFVVGCAANSVGTTLDFTVTCVTRVTSNRGEVHPLNSQHSAMVRTSNIAELVLNQALINN